MNSQEKKSFQQEIEKNASDTYFEDDGGKRIDSEYYQDENKFASE